MNTKKIMNKNRNSQQRFQFKIPDNSIICFTQPIQGLWCLIRGKWCKECFRMPIRISSTNIILHRLRLACCRIIHMAIENFMKLKNIIPCNRDCIKVFVDDFQHIPIAHNFLFVAVSRRRFFFNKLPDTRIRSNNAFNSIRCFCTLDFSNLNQFF